MALYVDSGHHMSGIAKSLFLESQEAAKAKGAKRLYVSAKPADASVGFYIHQDFQPTSEQDALLFKKEPKNIHMIKSL